MARAARSPTPVSTRDSSEGPDVLNVSGPAEAPSTAEPTPALEAEAEEAVADLAAEATAAGPSAPADAAPVAAEPAPGPASAAAAAPAPSGRTSGLGSADGPARATGPADRARPDRTLVVGPAPGLGAVLRVSTSSGELVGYVVATVAGSDGSRLRLLLEDVEQARRVEAALDLANAAGAALVRWAIGLGGAEVPAPITIDARRA